MCRSWPQYHKQPLRIPWMVNGLYFLALATTQRDLHLKSAFAHSYMVPPVHLEHYPFMRTHTPIKELPGAVSLFGCMYVECLVPRPGNSDMYAAGAADWTMDPPTGTWLLCLLNPCCPSDTNKSSMQQIQCCVFLRLTPEVWGVCRFQPQAAAEIFWLDFPLLHTVGSVACFVPHHNFHFYDVEQNVKILRVKNKREYSNDPQVCIELCYDIMQCYTKPPC